MDDMTPEQALRYLSAGEFEVWIAKRRFLDDLGKALRNRERRTQHEQARGDRAV